MPSKSKAVDLPSLNESLRDRSYVAGTYCATAEDMEVLDGLQGPIDKDKFPHVFRWQKHVQSLRASRAGYFVWPRVDAINGSAGSGGASSAPKKGRAAGKEKQQLEIDCPVCPVEDRLKPAATAPSLGAASTRVLGTKPASKETYYITTAIHYANGYPHVGHAYENLAADIFARYHRLLGQDVFFMTGNDEHGQKIATTAEDQGVTPLALCDKHQLGFLALNQRLLISNDFYMRTTSEAHKAAARELWLKCKAAGDIYLGKYEGWYLVREERFITDQEAEEWEFKDPGTGKPLTKMSEPSFFFKLSKYQAPILKLIEDHKEFLQPEQYRTEILERLKSIELRDLSISRGTFDWGVECPEDPVDGKKHVFYVWFDALTNYVSGVNGMDPSKALSRFWPADMHIIGKDIVWFHTVYWPAMLMSAGLPLPKSVVVHGFIAGPDGRKMSKSYGNVVNPHDELDIFPADSLRWYLCRESPYGDDLKFSQMSMALMHNADLCDNLGNLVQRAVTLSAGAVPHCKDGLVSAPFDLAALKSKVREAMYNFRPSEAADLTIVACKATNKWIADLEPWKMKTEDKIDLRAACLRTLLEAVYVLAHFFAPFIPKAAAAIFQKLQMAPKPLDELSNDFKNLKAGAEVVTGSILFSQLDASKYQLASAEATPTPQAAAKTTAAPKAKTAAPKAAAASPDQPLFSKLDVRVGKILKAWHHPEADRLFVEEVDIGEAQPRQIVSGLREHYTLDEFQGKKLLVVCNMKPAKMVKVESSGMVLCAKNPETKKVELLSVPDDCKVGDRVLPEGVASTWTAVEPNAVKKEKVWEGIAEKLSTNGDFVACFDGTPLTTAGGSRFLAPTLPNAPIS